MTRPDRAVILAAGFGKRLMPLTRERPKCMVPVAGKPIVVRTLEHFAAAGLRRATLVLGHAAAAVRDALGDEACGVALDYVINADYAVTNTMYSLLLAADDLRRGCYVIEGDGVLGRGVVDAVAGAEALDRSFWVVDHWDARITGCRLTTAPGDTRIAAQQIVREPDPDFGPRHFKSVGLLRLAPAQGALLAECLAAESEAGNRHVYYDDVFGKYVDDIELHALDIHGHRWMEVDDADDLARAEALFSAGS